MQATIVFIMHLNCIVSRVSHDSPAIVLGFAVITHAYYTNSVHFSFLKFVLCFSCVSNFVFSLQLAPNTPNAQGDQPVQFPYNNNKQNNTIFIFVFYLVQFVILHAFAIEWTLWKRNDSHAKCWLLLKLAILHNTRNLHAMQIQSNDE